MRKKRPLTISIIAVVILLCGVFIIHRKGIYTCQACCITATGTQWLIGVEPDNMVSITKMKYVIHPRQKYQISQPDHSHDWIISQGNDYIMGGLVAISSVQGPIPPCTDREVLNHRLAQ